MVVDNRMITKNAAGETFDISAGAVFDYAAFYTHMKESERLQVSKHELTWLQEYVRPTESAEVVLNLSCGVQETPHLMQLQVRLFEALGIDFAATAGTKYCCGRIFQRFGKDETGDKMAARSIDRFASWAPSTNVQCCGSCLIEFQYHVAVRGEREGTPPFEVTHITQFLRDKLREMGETVPWKKSIPRRVLLHAEGEEVHPTKVEARDAVIDTIDMIPGLEYAGLVKNPSFGQPCATKGPGEPSVLADLTPDQYREVQAELEAQARDAGADTIVTHHHMCHREWCKFGSDRLPIVHYQALLGEALGITVPDRFQTLWQLGDPDLVLERSRVHWESWGMSEADARAAVHRHFDPKYAAAVQRCPCGGDCAASPPPDGPLGAECEPSWNRNLTAAMQLPIVELPAQ